MEFRRVLVIEQANRFHLIATAFPLPVASSSNWNCIVVKLLGGNLLILPLSNNHVQMFFGAPGPFG